MPPFSWYTCFSWFCLYSLASARPNGAKHPRVLWQPSSPKTSWLECATQRMNGDLLVTRYDSSELWSVDTNTGNATLVYQFPSSSAVNSTLGIVEYRDDIFAVNAGQVRADGTPIAGTWSVWSIDLANWRTTGSTPPTATLISEVPNAGFLNGINVLNPATTRGPRSRGPTAKPFLLLADAANGVMYGIDMDIRKPSLFYSNPSLLSAPPGKQIPSGLNGIELPPVPDPKHVYFTTGFRGTFYRINLSPDGTQIPQDAEPELLLSGFEYLDDFILEADGTAYLTTSISNQVVKLSPDGKQTIIAEGDIVAQSTDAVLAYKGDRKVLFVTSGSRAGNDSTLIPGKITEIVLAS